MIKNTAFLAALTTFLLVAWVAGEVSYLATYKRALFVFYGWVVGAGVLLTFLNACALYYGLARWLFLRETGRKLLHLDRQLSSSDAVLDDLRRQLKS
jgi:hypothetical protein